MEHHFQLSLERFALAHGRATAMAKNLSAHVLSESVMDYCKGRSDPVGGAGRRSWLGIFESACHSLKSEAPDELRDKSIDAFSKALAKLDKVILGKKYRSDTAGTISGHFKNIKLAGVLVDAEQACERAVDKIGQDVIFERLFEQHVLPATSARAMHLFGDGAFSGTHTLTDLMHPSSVTHFNQMIRESLSGDVTYADLQAAARLIFTLPDLIHSTSVEPSLN